MSVTPEKTSVVCIGDHAASHLANFELVSPIDAIVWRENLFIGQVPPLHFDSDSGSTNDPSKTFNNTRATFISRFSAVSEWHVKSVLDTQLEQVREAISTGRLLVCIEPDAYDYLHLAQIVYAASAGDPSMAEGKVDLAWSTTKPIPKMTKSELEDVFEGKRGLTPSEIGELYSLWTRFTGTDLGTLKEWTDAKSTGDSDLIADVATQLRCFTESDGSGMPVILRDIVSAWESANNIPESERISIVLDSLRQKMGYRHFVTDNMIEYYIGALGDAGYLRTGFKEAVQTPIFFGSSRLAFYPSTD